MVSDYRLNTTGTARRYSFHIRLTVHFQTPLNDIKDTVWADEFNKLVRGLRKFMYL